MPENTNPNPNAPQGESAAIPEQGPHAASTEQPAVGQPAAQPTPEHAAAQPAPEQPAAQAPGAAVPPFGQTSDQQAGASGAQGFAGANAQSAPVPPYAQQAPQPFPPQPALVPQLTGGMKFGYFALGFLGNLLGILIAWLINADKHPAIRNSAIKWSVVGFACTFVIGILIGIAVMGFIGTVVAAVGAGAYTADPSSFSYYGTF